MLDKIAQPQKKKRMEMATYVTPLRISAITLMTILALVSVRWWT
jgi:hypothetical protein